MSRTKETARRIVPNGPVSTNVRYVENPDYISSVKGAESDENPVVKSEVFRCQTPPVESEVFKCQTPPVESEVFRCQTPPVESEVFKCQTPPVESDPFKCQTPPVESSAVVRVDVWKCERYKKNRYDPMTKVPMKGEKVKPFLYGRVVVFQLKGNSGSLVG